MGSLVEVALLKADKRPDTKLPSSKLPSKTAERLIHFRAPIPLPQPKPDVSNDAAPATPSTEAEQSFDAAGRLTLSGDAAAIATSFQRQLLAHIEPYRRYPNEAKQAKIEGSVQLLFTMDRSGRVLAIRVLNSSGNRALDREAVETVLRSQPLPAIPNDLPDPLNIALPVDFNLSQISGVTF
ncbi:MAG TPA: energy transducer TonB [Rhizomicrobium sp.]